MLELPGQLCQLGLNMQIANAGAHQCLGESDRVIAAEKDLTRAGRNQQCGRFTDQRNIIAAADINNHRRSAAQDAVIQQGKKSRG
ncbi:hypothetical protein UA70_00815 [Raoultella planticola]|nr:hypothetical protein UA70_00815 [Raoultella planticola]